MGSGKSLLTYSGLKKLEDELHELKVNRRREIAEKIREAKEQGDLSENAEYDAALDEQRDIETRIKEIEEILKNVEIVDEDEIDLDVVSVGCTVTLLSLEPDDDEDDEEVVYRIVGSSETDSLDGSISNESPLGMAMYGKRIGDTVTVEAPGGEFHYKILNIERS